MFITEACLSFFNFFPGKSLSLAAFHNGTLIIAILGIIIVVGLLTGIIPAIFMLRLKTIPSLKMVYKNNRLNSGLRNILVIFQFTVAIIFFICTLIMSDQLLYPEIKNIGLIDKNTFIFAAVVEIILSCLSLLGLIIFNAEKRTREIGIRKALGSSIRELNALLLKDFMAWIMVANALAWPIAWYAMKQWLQNFAYRVHFSPLHFLLAGFIIFVAAMLTVIYKTIKTASADPVESLKEING
jgi:ABC-type antimicrobial peptide transport system permease subunit